MRGTVTAAVSFTVEGTTVHVHMAEGATLTPADHRRLAAIVTAVQPPVAECPICRRHIGLTPSGRYYRPHNDKARHHCPMSRQEVIT